MHCGFVAIVGRPNVGKSTLLNRIVGQKVSITSHRPQTTRHRILGIKTAGETQYVYVDTPGMHLGAKSAINRFMNRTARSALADVDVVLFVVEALRWTDEDQNVAARLMGSPAPVILVVNKVDALRDKSALLPYLEQIAGKGRFAEIVPVSAGTGVGIADLERLVARRLPEGAHYFPEDQVTDRSERFLAAELVREKLMRMLRQELPYALTVEIERFKEDEGVLHVDAVVWVERKGQKAIVIGKGGATLKEVGKQARLNMEAMFGSKVFLKLWVKVKEGWADDERILKSLGYSDEH
jgi:GTP-binding protein Era